MHKSKTQLIIQAAILGGLLNTAMISSIAIAEETTAAATQSRQYNVPAGSLSSVLSEFAGQAGILLSSDAQLTAGKNSQGLTGQYSVQQALGQLLENTGIDYNIQDNTVTLQRLAVTQKNTEAERLKPVVVTGTRSIGLLADSPQAVTIVSREQIEKQSVLSSDLGEVLANTVPGMATSTEALSTTTQTLRGRHVFVLIDGVPQTISLRDGRRALKSIDPSAIERIEVLRGSSAIYGLGGTGSVINIITKRPGEGSAQLTTDITIGFAPTDIGESFRKRLAQGVEGSEGKVDYIFNASVEQTGGFFDGDGDRIPQDTRTRGGGTDAYNLFGKLGFDLDSQQRFELSANYYNIKQDVETLLVNGVVGEQKTTAIDGEVLGKKGGMENKQINFIYSNDNILGSRLKTQVYYRDFKARFGYFPDRVFSGGGQPFLDSQRVGARLDIETPHNLLSGGQILWGVDLLSEKTSQPLEDGRIQVPEMKQDTIGPFVQVELSLTDNLSLHGGVRYEFIRFEVDDFTTVKNNSVEGGTLNYDDSAFNLGAAYYFTDEISGFASFSQGFAVPEIGRTLRNAADGASVKNIRPEPQVVDNYELGIRGNWSTVQAELAFFYNISDLGASLSNPGTITEPFVVSRAPERIYGVEASFDAQPLEKWKMGGTLTWMEGKLDTNDDGDFNAYLIGNRIPPLKLTAYAEHETLPNWHNRLQLLYSGDRNRFDGESGFGRGEVKSYILMDLLSTVELDKGTLKLGVKNLLDEQYFPVMNQIFNFDSNYTAGQGRTISATYSIDW
jgi:iron complex outermembrane receptor protein